MRSVFLITLSILLFSGCSGRGTVSENQCAVGDWQTLGYRDGVDGYRSSRLLDHQDACMKHDIVPNRARYMSGWKEGMAEYCQPHNAFVIGERGWRHNNICSADLREEFLHSYTEGRQLYLARVEVDNLERDIDQKTARLTEIKSQIVSTAAAQLNPVLTPVERIDLATKVQRLHEEKQQLRTELPQLESELAIKSRELDRLNQTMAATTR